MPVPYRIGIEIGISEGNVPYEAPGSLRKSPIGNLRRKLGAVPYGNVSVRTDVELLSAVLIIGTAIDTILELGTGIGNEYEAPGSLRKSPIGTLRKKLGHVPYGNVSVRTVVELLGTVLIIGTK